MPANKMKHSAVKDIRPFPVDGVAGLRHDYKLAVGNVAPKEPHQRRRLHQIGVAGNEQRGHKQLSQPGPSDLICGLLPETIARHGVVFEFEPCFHSLRVRGPVGWTQFAKIGGHIVEALGTQSFAYSQIVWIAHSAGSSCERYAQEPLGMRQCVIDRHGATGSRSDNMEFSDPEWSDQVVPVIHRGARIILRHRRRVVVAAARVGDNAIACLGKDGLLRRICLRAW